MSAPSPAGPEPEPGLHQEPEPHPEPQAQAAGAVWRRMRQLVLEQYDRRAEVSAALGLSFIRIKVLMTVAAGPMTMGQLAERLNTDRPYLTVMVDDLERRSLVVRAPHPQDRRLKTVTATDTGRAAAATADRMLNRPPAALADLPAPDLAALARILRDVPAPPSPTLD